MKPGVHAVLKEYQDGKWALGIRAMPVEVRGNIDGLYTMLDIDQIVDLDVDCDGITKKPRLILKLHCKLSRNENQRLRHRLALNAARAGSPMLH